LSPPTPKGLIFLISSKSKQVFPFKKSSVVQIRAFPLYAWELAIYLSRTELHLHLSDRPVLRVTTTIPPNRLWIFEIYYTYEMF
jgi:hypothetical protein